ncbi:MULTISPECIES: response regulator transcription factor [Gordonibacter]|uniref:Response regulator transcription factor n=1 Tax=Gordonibacter faecis TaxID=3047475 RepID=A0ABT7DQS2_9ACTN|nr:MULTISPECIES: response regulator transcription factor [unclassified Gordonibacter]MDJ1651572.1 response regulator transcription factor [Gordonibacter sp. KGMB12511]HIW76994.1 response regulator transcription factor [Candidatus Gordonibacter avicola]
MAVIFIVEDDAPLREEVSHLLELQGHEPVSTANFDCVVDEILAAEPDCVLLDLKLPGAGGHAVCRAVRQESDVPIIMLTSSDSEFDEVMSMNLGADDYVTKPYNPAVLLARLQSVLRRSQRGEPSTRIAHKGVVLDVARGTVEHDGHAVELTRNELKILHLLMANHDTIISRQELMMELWQSDAFIDDNTLTVNVNRLRKSLASIGVPEGFLVTRRGQGYLV